MKERVFPASNYLEKSKRRTANLKKAEKSFGFNPGETLQTALTEKKVRILLIPLLILFLEGLHPAWGNMLVAWSDEKPKTFWFMQTEKQDDETPAEPAEPPPVPEKPEKKEKESPFSIHKLNYCVVNKWPSDEKAQIKFQFSAKYRMLEGDLNIFKYNYFPLYFAYTQKSFWNIGLPSAPFEESNYNPEIFFDYPLQIPLYERIVLRHLIISPYEHESNGQSGAESRSWNRQYIACVLGLKPKEPLDMVKSFIQDKIALTLKLWHAYGYEDQDAYLRSLGRTEDFLDYMGRGEINLSIRNLFGGGQWVNNQLDAKTRIFQDSGRHYYEFGLQQHIPASRVSAYLQYCDGYGESLLRFDRHDHRFFAGFSFSY